MQKYGNGNCNGGHGDYVQQFELRDGKRYPKHPAPAHTPSDFLIGHRGCCNCGDRHEFRDCSGKREHGAVVRVRFKIHCHQF